MAEILSANGFLFIVDDEDLPIVSNYRWYATGRGYLRANVPGGKYVLIHRLLMSPENGQQVDHINGNPLDNRKGNLRHCSLSENAKNRRRYKNNRSGFKGVYFEPLVCGKKEWVAQITVDGDQYRLGRYERKEDAARAYNRAAKIFHGKFASLNDV